MLGSGLDAGTGFLVGSCEDEDNIKFISQRNCFLTIEDGDGIEDMLTSAGAKLVKVNGNLNLLGEDAITFSNMLSSFDTSKATLKRPMKDGVINSQEESSAISIISVLVSGVLGKPKHKDETCVFSIPSNPLNSDKNNTFHSAMFKQILSKLGYRPVALNEALAVIYAENPIMGDMPMSGIAISMGAGQINICMAIRGYPVIEFSLVGSGDYIDKQVSILSGKPISNITKIKEKSLDFDNIDYNDVVLAGLDIHYTDLLTSLIKDFSKKFSESGSVYDHPIEIVITGGTAKPKGFESKFKSILKDMDLPFEVKGVRMSQDMLNTVSKGCLIKAIQEEKKLQKTAPKPPAEEVVAPPKKEGDSP
jgi:hypothetical protein